MFSATSGRRTRRPIGRPDSRAAGLARLPATVDFAGRHGALAAASSRLPRYTGACCLGHMFYNEGYMLKIQNLGEFEQIVLLAILRLREEAYGVSIRAEIGARTGRQATRGALYTTLDRLEEKGLVTSRMGDPTPIRGGRAKRYYAVSASGMKAIARAQRAYRQMLEGLEISGVRYA